jgi:hypothetical protein
LLKLITPLGEEALVDVKGADLSQRSLANPLGEVAQVVTVAMLG